MCACCPGLQERGGGSAWRWLVVDLPAASLFSPSGETIPKGDGPGPVGVRLPPSPELTRRLEEVKLLEKRRRLSPTRTLSSGAHASKRASPAHQPLGGFTRWGRDLRAGALDRSLRVGRYSGCGVGAQEAELALLTGLQKLGREEAGERERWEFGLGGGRARARDSAKRRGGKVGCVT